MKYLVRQTLSVLVIFMCAGISKPAAQNMPANNNQTIVLPVYKEVPLNAIKPKGWLLNQLKIMRDGTTGHLDEVYSKLKNDNGWLGGKGDGWEETPYWLDGAVPLAYLLDDAVLKEKVLKYINWTIENQRPSGYFGPITKSEREMGKKITVADCAMGEDWWPKMIMLKVLQQYYSATGDHRVITFMSRYFNYQLQTLEKCPVGKWTEWAQSRGTENMLVAQWLFQITKDPALIKLSGIISKQSFPWSNWFYERDWVMHAAAYQNEEKWMTRHGVNVAMALKDPAVQYQRTGDKKYMKALHDGFHDIMQLHGLPYGMFSSDEDLHGNDPTQGTELCAIVESMYSLENIIGITGDPHYMDALEKMTFNALPTQTTDDYNYKQYYQIANQVHIKRGVFNFSLPFEREMNNVLGMRSGYTCCLANMHQGWTKFTSHLWYSTKDRGLAALHFSPSSITTVVGKTDTKITIDEITNYPFSDEIIFKIKAPSSVEFPFHIRIPGWCSEATILINGKEFRKEKGGSVTVLDREWKNGDNVTIRLPMKVHITHWGRNSRAVERGPLVYALKLQEEWQKGTDEVEGDYFAVFPKSDWNFGLLDEVIKDPEKNISVKELNNVSDQFVWNLQNAPIELRTKARKIKDWKIVNDVAPQPVTSRVGIYQGRTEDKTEEITLIPYGCTKVRIVAFPVVK